MLVRLSLPYNISMCSNRDAQVMGSLACADKDPARVRLFVYAHGEMPPSLRRPYSYPFGQRAARRHRTATVTTFARTPRTVRASRVSEHLRAPRHLLRWRLLAQVFGEVVRGGRRSSAICGGGRATIRVAVVTAEVTWGKAIEFRMF